MHIEMHFAVDLKSGVPRKIVETPGRGKKKVDPIKKVLEKYSIITETAVSDDGTELPVTIVFKKCLSKGITHIPTAKPVPTQVPIPIDSDCSSAHVSAEIERPETVPGPLVLIGYGSYGVSIPVGFDPQIIALLERGFTVAYAHCRGGGEYGATWHEQGKGLKKRNTFTDYITIAEYLIKQGYTLPALLCGLGSSAGGLIMGVIANEAPHLFAALIMRYLYPTYTVAITITYFDSFRSYPRHIQLLFSGLLLYSIFFTSIFFYLSHF